MADDLVTAIVHNIQDRLDGMGRRFDRLDARLAKIENDIQGLMEILVGVAGTLRTFGERMRRLEERERA
jgi:uncharacterized protein (UPF0335 family)